MTQLMLRITQTILLISSLAIYSWSFAAIENNKIDQATQRDPTEPISAINAVNTADYGDNAFGIKLDMIITSKARNAVIINGQYLQMGDKINGLTITNIAANSIRIKDDTNDFVINMPYSDIKVAVNNLTPKTNQETRYGKTT